MNGDAWIKSEIRRLDDAVKDLRRAAKDRERSGDRALEANAVDLDRRVEALNEFRAQLAAQQQDFLTRAEYEAKHAALVGQVASLRELVSEVRRGVAWTTGRVAGAVATSVFIVTLIGVLLRR